ncbi:hypothetical protein Tco_0771623 [Tanacetum coccineum]|uniref:Uncharacterized protein n=1 Tax=Tanacetum coccineum TaxID=301880 RepID=A0ABQ4ZIG9_9ASTR
MTESPLMDSGLVVPVFSQGDDPIACLNKSMAFLTSVASSRGDKGKVILVLAIRVMLLVMGETMQVDRQGLLNATTFKVKDIWLGNALSLNDQGMQHVNDISNSKAFLKANNFQSMSSDVISEVPHSETYLNDMENQSVHAMKDFEQTPAQQDSMILSVIEQMSKQMINHVNNWEKANKEQSNKSVTAELERYKETSHLNFKQRHNIEFTSSRSPDKMESPKELYLRKEPCCLDVLILSGTPEDKTNDRAPLSTHDFLGLLNNSVQDSGFFYDFLQHPVSGLVLNPQYSQQPCISYQKTDDWDRLFKPMFDEYFNPPSIVVSPIQEVVAPRAVVLADSPVSTFIDQDAPSTSIPST